MCTQADKVLHLHGTLLQIDSNGNPNDSTPINIDRYKYNPYEEALNLQALFRKLPQDRIEDKIRTVTNFPLNYVDEDLPKRMIVYYIGKTS